MKLGRSSSVVLGFACLVLAAGCSAGAAEDTEGAGGGAAAQSATARGPERAVLTTKAIDETAQARTPTEYAKECVVKGDFVEVSGIPAQAAAPLNAALRPGELNEFHAGTCEEPYDVETHVRALMNDRGVLTVQHSGNSYYSGAAHPNAWLHGKSYLLATGAELKVADVFADATGKELVEKILAKLSQGTDGQKGIAETYGDSMRSNPEWLPFVLLPEGVSFYFTAYAGHADFALATEGLVIPYAELEGLLKSSSPAARVWTTTPGRN